MLRYKKDTPYFSILFDLEKNDFKVVQRWRYNWNNIPGTSRWTYTETKDFHRKVERLIRSVWGGKLLIKIIPGSTLPMNYLAAPIKTSFEVNWVMDNSAHWTAAIHKTNPNTYQKGDIRWDARKLSLDSPDQSPINHKFAHTGSGVLYIPGTYLEQGVSWENTLNDFPGIMNTGTELKRRHLDFIRQTINGLVPGMKFELSYGK